MRTERTVSRTGHVRAFTEASGLRKDTITASEAAPSIAAPILLPNSDIVSPYADPSSHLSTRPVDLCAHDSGGAPCYLSKRGHHAGEIRCRCLASGLALAVRPAGLVKISRATLTGLAA